MDAALVTRLCAIERGLAALEDAPTRTIVVEPLAVREGLASQMLGMSVESLRAHRKMRTGPPYRKIGATVVYVVADLRAWLAVQPSPKMAG